MRYEECTQCGAKLGMYHRFRKCDECEPIHFADVKVGDLVEIYHQGMGFTGQRVRREAQVRKVTAKRIETNEGTYIRDNGKQIGKDNRYNHIIHPDEADTKAQYKLVRMMSWKKVGA